MSIKNQNWILLNNEIMVKDNNGDFQLHKDKEAVRSYFLEKINKNITYFKTLEEKLKYLIENDYYIDFFKYYKLSEIKKVYKLLESKKFRFPSYMSASKFYESYALKDDDGVNYLELYEDRLACVALFLAKDEEHRLDKALDYAELLINQEYQPATPTFLNAGKKRAGELVSCFLDETYDSLDGIGYTTNSAMHLSSIGGGVSFNFSKLRARGEAIKGVEGRASGVLPVMKVMEDVFSYANQLGQRDGAGAIYLNIFHSDIEEFLDCKKINADEKVRMKSLSIGVIIPDKFMELAEKDDIGYVFYPHTVYSEYGQFMDDMDFDNTDMYEKLVNNPKVKKKKINPRNLLVKIAQIQKESGYPYIFFKGNVNKSNWLSNIGQVKFSNLCTEVLQVSDTTDIKTFGEETKFNYGISCVLGSLNIANVMDNKSIDSSVKLAIRALSIVVDETNITKVPTIAKANRELRSVGLGAMNLHGYLAKNNIMYESKEALEFTDKFFMLVNYYSLMGSMEISKEKSSPFTGFEGSDYASGVYFDKYLKDYNTEFESPKVEKLFEDIDLPTIEEWKQLQSDVEKYGLYNAYRLTIAPNQSTSYIMNSTASIMPIVDNIEVREYGKSTTYYPMPFLTNENYFYFKSAYDMNQYKVMDLIATAQKHIDQGISCILHTNSEDTTRDLARYYIYAHKVGLKTLYYTRTRKSSIADCVSCSA